MPCVTCAQYLSCSKGSSDCMQAKPHLITEVVIHSAAFRGKNWTITVSRIIEVLLIQSQGWERDFYMRFLLVLHSLISFKMDPKQSPFRKWKQQGLAEWQQPAVSLSKAYMSREPPVRWLRLVWLPWVSGIHIRRLDHVFAQEEIDTLQESPWN